MTASATKPTRIRFLIVGVAFLSALLLYLHRYCLSFTQQFVKEDFGLSNDQFSWCLSAFFFAYALGQVPSGWMSDRFGARLMLAVYILTWSAFTALVGAVSGFVMLLVMRIGIGLGQAGAYPTCAALVGRWVPTPSRGRANSFVAFGGRIGGFLAPVLTAYLVIGFVPSGNDTVRIQYEDVFDEDILALELVESFSIESDASEEELAQFEIRRLVILELSVAATKHAQELVRRQGREELERRRKLGAWAQERRHPGPLHIEFVKAAARIQGGRALETGILPVQQEARWRLSTSELRNRPCG